MATDLCCCTVPMSAAAAAAATAAAAAAAAALPAAAAANMKARLHDCIAITAPVIEACQSRLR